MIVLAAIILIFSVVTAVCWLWVEGIDRANNGQHIMPRATLRKQKRNRSDLRKALGRQ